MRASYGEERLVCLARSFDYILQEMGTRQDISELKTLRQTHHHYQP